MTATQTRPGAGPTSGQRRKLRECAFATAYVVFVIVAGVSCSLLLPPPPWWSWVASAAGIVAVCFVLLLQRRRARG